MRKYIEDAEGDFTHVMLMSLVVDVTCLAKNIEYMKGQILSLAKEHGVHVQTRKDEED